MKRTPLRRSTRAETSARVAKPRADAAVKVKQCSCCASWFTPVRPLQDVCSIPCAKKKARLAREAKERAERETTKARKEALKKLPKLIAEAQFYFNSYIRLRDADETCFVCGRPFDPAIPGRVMHAGHIRSRGAAGHLRFCEDNCMGECEGCNGPHGAKPHEIEAGAIRRIGQARYDALKNDNAPHKWTHDEVRAIRDTYRAKARELKKQRESGTRDCRL